jgi:hypothetical protein
MALGRRPDGSRTQGLAPLRRIMPLLLPRRNDAYVLFEQQIPTAPLTPLLATLNATRAAESRITLFHCVLRALGLVFTEFPRLNRFVVGGHTYDRRGIHLSLSAKQRLDREAPVFSTKLAFDARESLAAMTDRLLGALRQGRDGDAPSDREIRSLLPLPAPLLRAVMWAQRRLDARGLLPARLLADDPLYASAFVANLGSVGLDAAYHHLFEYGTVPIFVTMGRTHRAPVVLDDHSVGSREIFVLRYTYDERIADGFYAARALERLADVLAEPETLSGASSA